MDITLETASLESLRTGVLVVGAFADGTLPSSARAIDEASKGKLSAVIKRGDLDAKAGSALMLHDLPGIAAERVLTVSLGQRDNAGDKTFRGAAARQWPGAGGGGGDRRSGVPRPLAGVARPAGEPAARRWRLSVRCPRYGSQGRGRAGRRQSSPTRRGQGQIQP